jgi:hypothetical protein
MGPIAILRSEVRVLPALGARESAMKEDYIDTIVRLAKRLDSEWFRSRLRARLPDGDRMRAKDRWIMRGVLLAVRLREPRPLSDHATPCAFPRACARCSGGAVDDGPTVWVGHEAHEIDKKGSDERYHHAICRTCGVDLYVTRARFLPVP